MSLSKLNISFFIVLIAIFLALQSIFVVDQREQALVLQLGSPVGEAKQPGLHFKIPFIQEVRRFDRRILSVDPRPEQVVIASSTIAKPEPVKITEDKPAVEGEEQPAIIAERPKIQNVSGEPIIVDSFARYKITNPLQFMKTLRTISKANGDIENILNDATRSVLGNTSLRELLSAERTNIMNSILQRVNSKVEQGKFGIEIVDVRIVRADLTEELRTSTVRRMISELQERATETRAKGDERAKEIRALADKERTILMAEADRDSQILRGEGDKQSIKIYADAFNKDAEFYGFMRSMEAYKKTLADPDTRLILSPSSDFFKHFETQR